MLACVSLRVCSSSWVRFVPLWVFWRLHTLNFGVSVGFTCRFYYFTFSFNSRVTINETPVQQTLIMCLSWQALPQYLQFISKLAVCVRFQETTELLRHREMSWWFRVQIELLFNISDETPPRLRGWPKVCVLVSSPAAPALLSLGSGRPSQYIWEKIRGFLFWTCL